MKDYSERLKSAIPGGAHTYSRGDDQFPANAPPVLERAKGAYVYDPEGKRYLDYGMALRAVNIGYSEDAVNRAAIRQIENGNNLTRPSTIEMEAAELIADLIDSIERVKFAKNGSTAMTAAVKLARGYTGREMVARCADHPFFSYDDWFIASTPMTRGIPKETPALTKCFRYNEIESLESLIDEFPGQFACVVLEPAQTEEPRDEFLQKVKSLCEKSGIVLILDEMITGFRWDLKGGQHYYGVRPDLCAFGKAMANGFSVACVGGRKEIMDQGSLEPEGGERLFLTSTTHGAEMCGLGAFVAAVQFMREHSVVEHLWDYGGRLTALIDACAKEAGVGEYFKTKGVACSPHILALDAAGNRSLEFHTLFMQEMVEAEVLIPWIALCYRHGEEELALTKTALQKSFAVYKKALEDGVEKYLRGPAIKPVFRKFN